MLSAFPCRHPCAEIKSESLNHQTMRLLFRAAHYSVETFSSKLWWYPNILYPITLPNYRSWHLHEATFHNQHLRNISHPNTKMLLLCRVIKSGIWKSPSLSFSSKWMCMIILMRVQLKYLIGHTLTIYSENCQSRATELPGSHPTIRSG